MARLTGTHIYTFAKCPRAVALDLHGDPAQRRELTAHEAQLLARGREHEARVVAGLGYRQPEYPERDFVAGAAATVDLLRAGVAGVHQGVLLDGARLGIPDLLRREAGPSRLGDWHYVVGDVKSSKHARSDQLLQVAFYSRLLGRAQERSPEYGYLLLKDGREERFALADYAETIDEVLAGAERLLAPEAAARERPFWIRACGSCRWSELCAAELEAKDDLALLQRMTRGLRTVLEGAGVTTCAAAAQMATEAVTRRTHLEAPLVRRIRRAAEARCAKNLLPEPRGRQNPLGAAAIVHLEHDAFEERVRWFGVLCPAHEGGAVWSAAPAAAAAELEAFLTLIRRVPENYALAHYGPTLPKWFAQACDRRAGVDAIEHRFVDLAPRFRGAAVFPGPVFDLAGHVRFGLAKPHAANGPDELLDLARLRRRLLDDQDGPVVRAEAAPIPRA